MDLNDVLTSRVDANCKGFPSTAPAMALSELGRQDWHLLRGDLPLPAAVLKDSAIRNNSAWMRSFLGHFGARLAPHGKTTMAPQLFQRQLADGAWAITVATVQQLEVCRRFGVPRILMANQVVGRTEIDAILSALTDEAGPEIYLLVDSLAGVAALKERAGRAEPARPLHLLVEGGYEGGRTGARTLERALEVARAVSDGGPELVLSGIEGFEGQIAGDTPRETEARIERFLEFLVEVARACDREGLFRTDRIILSAGGSGFFDLVARRFSEAALSRPVDLIVRSGCYLTHDSHHFEELFQSLLRRTPEAKAVEGKLLPAIEVWAYVQSTPESRLAILTVGKRDISFDIELPIPLKWYRPDSAEAPQTLGAGFRVTALNDQHAYLECPADHPLRYGDMVCLGISHPCTTFDKWSVIPVVDDDYRVIDAVRTFF